MPKIELQHRTSLLASQIKEGAEGLVQGVLDGSEEIIADVQQHWEGNTLLFSLKALGFLISGEIMVENRLITVRIKLPFFAAIMLGNKIKSNFKEKAQELFP